MGYIGFHGEQVTSDQVRYWLENAQTFVATTGVVAYSGGATPKVGVALFNPSTSGKNILISSITWFSQSFGIVTDLGSITSDPAYATSITPQNQKLGGAGSALAAHCTYTNAAQTTTNTELSAQSATAGVFVEALTNGRAILLPAGSGEGILVSPNLGGNGNWGVNIAWAEVS